MAHRVAVPDLDAGRPGFGRKRLGADRAAAVCGTSKIERLLELAKIHTCSDM